MPVANWYEETLKKARDVVTDDVQDVVFSVVQKDRYVEMIDVISVGLFMEKKLIIIERNEKKVSVSILDAHFVNGWVK